MPENCCFSPLPPLPYPADALRPHLNAQTVETHYRSHCIPAAARLARLLPEATRGPLQQALQLCRTLPQTEALGCAGSVFAHLLYFRTLQCGTSQPYGYLRRALEHTFGAADGLYCAFFRAAETLDGAGWIWLCRTPQGLQVLPTANNALPPQGWHPILCCDMWEHAYYLQYGAQWGKYLAAWYARINWQRAEERYLGA